MWVEPVSDYAERQHAAPSTGEPGTLAHQSGYGVEVSEWAPAEPPGRVPGT